MINSQDNGLEEQVGHLDLLDFILLAFYLRDYIQWRTLWLLAHKRTIPTERLPLVSKVSANFGR
jgi:hypothetical protein